MPVLSSLQLWSLVLLFQMGSNLVFGFGAGAKQDAWIAAGISTIAGCILIWVYCKTVELNTGLNWVPLLIRVFGSVLGNLLSTLYILAFLYGAGRVLRDFGELLHTYILPKTPIGVTMALLALLIAYSCYVGIERMARVAEIGIILMLLFLLVQIIFLFSSGLIQPSLLQPVATDWTRILKTAFPLGVNVPFGETLAFAMFWVWTGRVRAYRKALFLATISAGILFIVLDVLTVATLGPEMFSVSLYPLLATFRLISFADFVENLDPLVVTNFLITGTLDLCFLVCGLHRDYSAVWAEKPSGRDCSCRLAGLSACFIHG